MVPTYRKIICTQRIETQRIEKPSKIKLTGQIEKFILFKIDIRVLCTS